jgi:glyoxylase-like metal-dependent hydrolase (beta-lactamase superfamily II)
VIAPSLEKPITDVALAEGVTLHDDWFAVKPLDKGTYAIGEPAYHQCNWSYLISDGQEGLLWDTGSGRRPLCAVISRLCPGSVRALPSHLHYDHLGNINGFGPVILPDLPILRGLETDAGVTPPEDMFLGSFEDLAPPTFRVGDWIGVDTDLAVGRRRMTVLHTPGHSPDSVSLWELGRKRLYAADFIYPGEVYAQVPGASLSDYALSLRTLLKMLPEDVQIVCAHGQEEGGVHDVPQLAFGDLEDLLLAVDRVSQRSACAGEERVNARMKLLYSENSFRS